MYAVIYVHTYIHTFTLIYMYTFINTRTHIWPLTYSLKYSKQTSLEVIRQNAFEFIKYLFFMIIQFTEVYICVRERKTQFTTVMYLSMIVYI
jgi:hypothetical protein